jgi:NhaP-type Na+/H+ and K+/H+ antiporter
MSRGNDVLAGKNAPDVTAVQPSAAMVPPANHVTQIWAMVIEGIAEAAGWMVVTGTFLVLTLAFLSGLASFLAIGVAYAVLGVSCWEMKSFVARFVKTAAMNTALIRVAMFLLGGVLLLSPVTHPIALVAIVLGLFADRLFGYVSLIELRAVIRDAEPE